MDYAAIQHVRVDSFHNKLQSTIKGVFEKASIEITPIEYRNETTGWEFQVVNIPLQVILLTDRTIASGFLEDLPTPIPKWVDEVIPSSEEYLELFISEQDEYYFPPSGVVLVIDRDKLLDTPSLRLIAERFAVYHGGELPPENETRLSLKSEENQRIGFTRHLADNAFEGLERALLG